MISIRELIAMLVISLNEIDSQLCFSQKEKYFLLGSLNMLCVILAAIILTVQ